MKTQIGLKAIILVTEFNNTVVVDEISGNDNFIDDIKHYNGYVDDIFYEMDIPKEIGFYEFAGQVLIGVDINGNVDETIYSGEFTKIDGYKFTIK
jgi:hypothetical protein